MVNPVRPALAVTLAYVALATAWLVFFDHLLADPGPEVGLPAVRDGLAVLVTAGILFGLVHQAAARIGASQRTLEITAAQLRVANDALGAVIDASPLAIVAQDAQGRVTSWNATAQRMFGWAASEVLGRPCPLMPADRAEGIQAILGRVLGGEVLTGQRVPVQHRDGSPRDISLSVAPIHDAAGSVVGAIGLHEDVTERTRSGEERRLLHEFDSLVLQGHPLQASLVFLCQRVADLHALPLVQISLKGVDGAIDVRAFAGAASEFLSGVVVRWDQKPEGRGPTGTAIRTARTVVMDVETHPDFAPWRERAREFGLRTGAALPLVAKGETMGALSVYASGPDVFDAPAVASLQGIADQAALSLIDAIHQQQLRIQTAALEATANAVLISDRQGIIRWVNPAFTRLTGWSAGEAVGRTPRLLKSGVQSDAFYQNMWETVLGGQVWQGEIYNRHQNGSLYVEEQTITPVRDNTGAITHFIAVKQDVSERKRQEEQIRHLAMHDPLTELPNRRALADTLSRSVDRARRGEVSAILFLDLDHFKLVNDTVGHLAGDRLLISVAALLKSTLRPADLLARLGGDEFAVLLEGRSLEDAMIAAERLRQAVDDSRFQVEGRAFNLGVSIGLSPIDGALDAEAVLGLADSAVYAAKDQGGNRIVVYRDAREAAGRLAEASEWAARVKTALKAGSFVLHFQPVVRLSDGRVSHVEALLRMREENGDLVYPSRFLHVAESFGLMPQIDQWVLDEVLRILPEHPELKVFVNLSGASLSSPSLLDHIEERVRKADLKPGRLVFEVTETAAVSDLAVAQLWIRRLKDMGCLFALDDFGMGFSSFTYLRALPADYVKIDASFVRNVDTDSTNRALVQAIRAVAHALGKEVIAEAVESHAVATVLRELHVEHGQGYYLGVPSPNLRPAPAEERGPGPACQHPPNPKGRESHDPCACRTALVHTLP